MTDLRQAAQQALDELANAKDHIYLLPENAQALTEAEMLERLRTAITALRAALAEPERKPLSDEQIALISVECAAKHLHDDFDFARAIERAHGIGDSK